MSPAWGGRGARFPRRRLATAWAAVVGTMAAATGAHAAVRLTDNGVDDVLLQRGDATGGRIYAVCDGHACLLPDTEPIGPDGTTLTDAARGMAIGSAPAAAYYPGATGRVPVFARAGLVAPLVGPAQRVNALPDGSCPVVDLSGAAALDLTGPLLPVRFGGRALTWVARTDGCPPSGGCPVPTNDLYSSDGAAWTRLTSDCWDQNATAVPYASDGGSVAWTGIRQTGAGTPEARCGVYVDDRAIVERAIDPGPCDFMLLDYRDGAVLFETSDAAGARVLQLGRDGGVPVTLLAGDEVSGAVAKLLHGGMVTLHRPNPDGLDNLWLSDDRGELHLLYEGDGGVGGGGAESSTTDGRYVYWIDEPGMPDRLYVWDNAAGAATEVPLPAGLGPGGVGAAVIDGDRIAFPGSYLPRRAGDPEIYLVEDGVVVPVTANDFPDDSPVLAGSRLYWLGRPDPGADPDWEIFTGDPLPRFCFHSGYVDEYFRSGRLANVLVTLTYAGGTTSDWPADDEGCLPYEPEGLAKVRVTLRDRDGLVRVFDHAPADIERDVVWFEFDAPFPGPDLFAARPASRLDATNVPDDVEPHTTRTAIFPDADNLRLRDLAQKYHYVERAARFARRNLFAPGVLDDIGDPRPALGEILVLGYATGAFDWAPPPKLAVFDRIGLFDRPALLFGGTAGNPGTSDAAHPGSPTNVDLHEYGHYLQWVSRMGGVNAMPSGGGCEQNHAGLVNGSSEDSVAEGWAEFFALALRRDELMARNPALYVVSPTDVTDYDVDPLTVWSNCGEEEGAAGAVLWDALTRPVRHELVDLWVALNRGNAANLPQVFAALKADPAHFAAADVDASFDRRGVCHDVDGNRSCDPGEVLGAAAFDWAFAVRMPLDGDDPPVFGCAPPPCPPTGGTVLMDRAGHGRLGSLPLDGACALPARIEVCRGHGQPAFFPLPAPDFGDLAASRCPACTPGTDPGWSFNENAVLVLPNPLRQGRPDDRGPAVFLRVEDAGSGEALEVAVLRATVACTGADAPLGREAAGPVHGLPRYLAVRLPEGACSMQVTASAPGYAISEPLLLDDGTIPDSHTFVLSPSGEPALPALGAVATPAAGPAPLAVHLAAVPSGGVAPYAVRWMTGDGASIDGAEADHVYESVSSAPYHAVAIAQDSLGNRAVAEVTITVTGGGGGDGDADAGPDGELDIGADVDATRDGPTSDAGAGGGGAGCGCRASGGAPGAWWLLPAVLWWPAVFARRRAGIVCRGQRTTPSSPTRAHAKPTWVGRQLSEQTIEASTYSR
ncbi:MAG: PKD domain-containing protein [Deltaproteobacteria bacterium]|nr:PKD domain-containing protein [Deltaproteobacteria bacterium]